MNGYVSKSTFARIYGCRPSYVTKLNAEKKLVLDQDGVLVNVDASLRLIEASRDLSKSGVRERWAAYRAGKPVEQLDGIAAPVAAQAPAEPAPTPESREGSRYHSSRADREAAEAALKQLELRERLGELIEREPAVKSVASAVGAARSALLELPDRLAGLLAAETDAGKCHEMLLAEIERVLRALEQQAKAMAGQGVQ